MMFKRWFLTKVMPEVLRCFARIVLLLHITDKL